MAKYFCLPVVEFSIEYYGEKQSVNAPDKHR